jgi:hypothetical protein
MEHLLVWEMRPSEAARAAVAILKKGDWRQIACLSKP